MAVVPLHHLAIDADPVPDLHDHFDDLDAGRFQQRLSAHWRRSGRPHSRAGDARHPLSAARCRGSVDGGHRLRAAAGASAGVFYDEAAVEMKLSLRGVATEAKLLLIGIPLLLWTCCRSTICSCSRSRPRIPPSPAISGPIIRPCIISRSYSGSSTIISVTSGGSCSTRSSSRSRSVPSRSWSPPAPPSPSAA